MIYLAGLGAGNPEDLTQGLKALLEQKIPLRLRTAIHPTVDWLQEQGYVFQAFDAFYEQAASFEDVYRQIAEAVVQEAEQKDLIYAVPGHPMVAEKSVQLILAKAKERQIACRVLPAVSFLDAVFAVLQIDPAEGFCLLDGLGQQKPNPELQLIVTQVYDQLTASEVKLNLLEYYSEEQPVKVVQAAGIPGQEKVVEIPLYELDRLDWLNHLTCLWLPPSSARQARQLAYLAGIVEKLRSENGCPWDREQNHQSLQPCLLEESYEVIEAIQNQDMDNLCEELGDLLLQVVFHAQLAKEEQDFELGDVIEGISQKMIRRHPHVFGQVQVANSQEVLANWDEIKKQEKKQAKKSILDGIPESFTALIKSQKLQKKAAKVGFDWPDYRGAMDKVYEELDEVKEALASGSQEELQKEVGDVFFALVNLARLLKLDSETVLVAANRKFTRRFQQVEQKVQASGRDWSEYSLDELEQYWQEIKICEKLVK